MRRKLAVGILVMGVAVWALAQTHVRIVGLSVAEQGVQMSRQPAAGKARVWSQAVTSLPVVEGDAVRTGPAGRAEVQLECDSALRLAPASEFSFPQLGLSQAGVPLTTVDLSAGAAAFSLRRADTKELQIQLPSGSIAATGQNTRFLVQVGADSSVRMVAGHATVEVGGRAFKLEKSDLLTWSGAQPPQRGKAGPLDAFAKWSQKRDRDFDRDLMADRPKSFFDTEEEWSAMNRTPSTTASRQSPATSSSMASTSRLMASSRGTNLAIDDMDMPSSLRPPTRPVARCASY